MPKPVQGFFIQYIMADNKKSFIAYCDWKESFEALPDDKAGQLIKHLFRYVNDENPQTDDIIINAVFANIKNALKRDLVKYQVIREKRSEAGKRSAELRQQSTTKATCVKSVQQKPTNSTVSVSVSVNDNDSVNDNVIKEIYSLYPSKCPIKGSGTGKCAKDKEKIKKLLKSIEPDKLILTIKTYIADCKKSNTYIKNFSTFLNNIPDYDTNLENKNGYTYLTDEEKERKQVPIKWTYIHYKDTYKKVHSNGQGDYVEDGTNKIYI